MGGPNFSNQQHGQQCALGPPSVLPTLSDTAEQAQGTDALLQRPNTVPQDSLQDHTPSSTLTLRTCSENMQRALTAVAGVL